jgi:hypothetical protein
LRGDLDAILLTALRKEPERRYRSALDLAADIERWLSGHPVAARPDSLAYKTSKFVLRHKIGTALAPRRRRGLAVALILFFRRLRSRRNGSGQVLRLSDLARLDDYVAEADELWPAEPARVAAIESWLVKGRGLAGNLAQHRATLAALRADRRGATGEEFAFDDVETQWQHDKTTELVARLRSLRRSGAGASSPP